MTIHRPTLAIVTICFNSEKYIGDTLKSVAEQTLPPNEFVVVDGGSSDATLEIVTNYAGTVTKVISEPDHGISDAMNKGIAHTNSDYILFLHSDDFLSGKESLEKAIKLMTDGKDIYGFAVTFRQKDKEKKIVSKPFGFWTNFKTRTAHQGVFCHRRVFKALEGFDKQFRIAMDYDFFLRAMRANFNIEPIDDLTLSVMRDTGISSRTDWCGLKERFSEERKVHEKNCPSKFMQLLYSIWWMTYPTFRYVKEKLKTKSLNRSP